jgi:hypothetical protein
LKSNSLLIHSFVFGLSAAGAPGIVREKSMLRGGPAIGQQSTAAPILMVDIFIM